MHTVLLDKVLPQPWRNGGGVTQELLSWPPPAHPAAGQPQGWQCRISVARIDHNGPFSAFPGVARWFTVLGGEGVVLRFAARRVLLGAGSEPLHFDGAAPPHCDLLDGPTQDLNFMLRRDSGRGAMCAAPVAQAWDSDAPLRAVFTLDAASLCVPGQPVLQLAAGSLTWADQAAHQVWQLASSATPVRAWWLFFKPLPT
jgi:uncharacterized protein